MEKIVYTDWSDVHRPGLGPLFSVVEIDGYGGRLNDIPRVTPNKETAQEIIKSLGPDSNVMVEIIEWQDSDFDVLETIDDMDYFMQ